MAGHVPPWGDTTCSKMGILAIPHGINGCNTLSGIAVGIRLPLTGVKIPKIGKPVVPYKEMLFFCWLRAPFAGAVGSGIFLTLKPSFPNFGYFAPHKWILEDSFLKKHDTTLGSSWNGLLRKTHQKPRNSWQSCADFCCFFAAGMFSIWESQFPADCWRQSQETGGNGFLHILWRPGPFLAN